MELRLRGTSTTQSHRTPIYYVDLAVRDGQTIAKAIALVREQAEKQKASGFDQEVLEAAAHDGLGNAFSEESDEEVQDILEGYYPEHAAVHLPIEPQPLTGNLEKIRELKSKLASPN